MKIKAAQIEVRLRGGTPQAFRYQGRWRTVERIGEQWMVVGRWWATESRRHYFTVITPTATMMILPSAPQPPPWPAGAGSTESRLPVTRLGS